MDYRIENDKIVIGEGDKWLEILGCGMAHPNVLKNAKVDPKNIRDLRLDGNRSISYVKIWNK